MSENNNEMNPESLKALEWESGQDAVVEKAGRPTDYRAEYDEQAEKLCELGATDKQLANFFNVSETTINNWKIAHPSFFESITRGKALPDNKVEQALFKTAIGYDYIEESEGTGGEGGGFTARHRRRALGDFRAQRFWLMNRRPEQWREKIETTNKHEIDGGETLKSIMAEINDSITHKLSTENS